MRGRLGLTILGVVAGGFGCSDEFLQLSLDDFSVAFLVVEDKERGPIDFSDALIHTDLQPGFSAQPEIVTKEGEETYLVTVPRNSPITSGFCWDETITLQEPAGVEPVSNQNIRPIERGLSDDVSIWSTQRSPDDETRLLRAELANDVSWRDDLVIRATVDVEGSRPSYTNLASFQDEGLAEFLAGLPNHEDPEWRQGCLATDLAPIDAQRLVVSLTCRRTGVPETFPTVALVESGRPFRPDDGRWVQYPSAAQNASKSLAVGTSTSGVVYVVFVGDTRIGDFPVTGNYPPRFGGLVWQLELTDADGLVTVRGQEEFSAVDADGNPLMPSMRTVSIRDAEVVVGGAIWDVHPDEVDPDVPQRRRARRIPALYRWPLRAELPDIDSVFWSTLESQTKPQNAAVRRILITNDEERRYAATTDSAVHMYDVSTETWTEQYLLYDSVVPEHRFFGLDVSEDNQHWWLADNDGYIFRSRNGGDNWMSVDVAYPPRFLDCSSVIDSEGILRYRMKPIPDVAIVDDYLFMALKECAALVAVQISCVMERVDALDVLRGYVDCTSVILPSEAPSEPSCRDRPPESYLLRLSEEHVRVAVAEVEGNLVTLSQDGSVLIARLAPSP